MTIEDMADYFERISVNCLLKPGTNKLYLKGYAAAMMYAATAIKAKLIKKEECMPDKLFIYRFYINPAGVCVITAYNVDTHWFKITGRMRLDYVDENHKKRRLKVHDKQWSVFRDCLWSCCLDFDKAKESIDAFLKHKGKQVDDYIYNYLQRT